MLIVAPSPFSPAFQSRSSGLTLRMNAESARELSRPSNTLPCQRSMTADNGASQFEPENNYRLFRTTSAVIRENSEEGCDEVHLVKGLSDQ
jgi:hypothetical protein